MTTIRLLKNINLFIDGRGYAGQVDEFDPPKLTIKMEEHRAGGMDAPVEEDMGMEKLESGFTLSQADREALKLFGMRKGNYVPLELRGVQQSDTGENEAVTHFLRGQIKEVDWGTWKPGEKAPCKFMVALRYYKLEIAGETVHEIDIVNMVRIIDGTDQLADMRQGLGL